VKNFVDVVDFYQRLAKHQSHLQSLILQKIIKRNPGFQMVKMDSTGTLVPVKTGCPPKM